MEVVQIRMGSIASTVVRRHLGVAVGTAAGRWWTGTLRHWPLLGAFHGALPQAANEGVIRCRYHP